MILSSQDHVAEILNVEREQHGVPERDPIIVESWLRCMNEHQLDPTVAREVWILQETLLREHQERMEEFMHTARFGLESLYRQVAGMGYVVLLTDPKGITIDFMGDPTFDNQLRKAGLYLGADWSECYAGTNGVGTCISTGKPLVVHQSDHFDSTHIALTCSAAPVFDPYGQVSAILDISALKSPLSKSSQHLALQFVKLYSHRIEKANFLKEFGKEWIVKLGSSQEFIDVDPEYLLALDGSGRILGFNQQARLLLEREVPGRHQEDLRGCRFEELFECSLEHLEKFVLSRPADQRSLRTATQRRTLFAQVAPPPRSVSPSQRANSVRRLSSKPSLVEELTGGDPVLMRHLERAARLVNSNVSILLSGETGTGKEYFAKALHRHSTRADRPFVAVNCAAIPESLIESELFGYAPGTFTGAQAKGKRGLILQADGGTLFLDEIGDMPYALQARLLRVLSEREVLPLGAVTPVSVDVRIISATHHDLVQLVHQQRFRDDLYYRLNGAVFELPPLRERQDFSWLIKKFLGRIGGSVAKVSPEAMHLLKRHSWPGNLRELSNALEFAAAVGTDGVIRAQDLPELFLNLPSGRLVDLHADYAHSLYSNAKSADHSLSASFPAKECSPAKVHSPEAQHLETALSQHQWNASATARTLGIGRATLYRRMNRFGIIPPNRR